MSEFESRRPGATKSKLPLQELNAPESAATTGTPPGAAAGSAGGSHENILRPKTLGEYIGQKSVAAKLEVFIQASKVRRQPLDHVLLSGPPGLGKTTLAHIVANEMGGTLHQAPGPTLEKSADLLSILSEIKAGDVLFIDEIHRLNPVVEEALYPAMEDFQVQLIVGEGPSAQSVTLNLERFTLVGATTQPGRITGPLRDRFGIHLGLDFYSFEEMGQILNRSGRILNIPLSAPEISAIAARSRGTPRIGNRLLARVRDFVEVMRNADNQAALSTRAQNVVREASDRGQAADPATAKRPAKGDVEMVQWALDFLDVDRRGLQPLDRRYLQVLMEQFRGGPAGVEAIAASLSEDRSTLEETIEPYLLKEGFIVRTARGRVATDVAYAHLGLARLLAPAIQQSLLGEDLG